MTKHVAPVVLACLFLLTARAADEITAKIELQNVNGSFRLEKDTGAQSFDQGQQGSSYTIQSIGTNAEQFVISSDITTNGWSYFRNVNTTESNAVDIGVYDAGVSGNLLVFLRLQGGGFWCGSLHPTNDVWMRAQYNAVNVEGWVLQR